MCTKFYVIYPSNRLYFRHKLILPNHIRLQRYDFVILHSKSYVKQLYNSFFKEVLYI